MKMNRYSLEEAQAMARRDKRRGGDRRIRADNRDSGGRRTGVSLCHRDLAGPWALGGAGVG